MYRIQCSSCTNTASLVTAIQWYKWALRANFKSVFPSLSFQAWMLNSIRFHPIWIQSTVFHIVLSIVCSSCCCCCCCFWCNFFSALYFYFFVFVFVVFSICERGFFLLLLLLPSFIVHVLPFHFSIISECHWWRIFLFWPFVWCCFSSSLSLTRCRSNFAHTLAST